MSGSGRRTRQSGASQLADAAFLLALLFGSLFVTTFVFAEEESSSGQQGKPVPVAQLPISQAEKTQYQQMVDLEMVAPPDVQAAVDANEPGASKYAISWPSLAGTIALAVAYLLFVYRMSFKEYRLVIAAKFGAKGEAS